MFVHCGTFGVADSVKALDQLRFKRRTLDVDEQFHS